MQTCVVVVQVDSGKWLSRTTAVFLVDILVVTGLLRVPQEAGVCGLLENVDVVIANGSLKLELGVVMVLGPVYILADVETVVGA